MKTSLLTTSMVVALILLIPIPIFAQEMWFYHNEMFDFSFDIPIDWSQIEEVWVGEKMFQVIMYPDEFSIQSLKDSEQLSMSDLVTGLPFSITAPLISIQFEILTQEKILP